VRPCVVEVGQHGGQTDGEHFRRTRPSRDAGSAEQAGAGVQERLDDENGGKGQHCDDDGLGAAEIDWRRRIARRDGGGGGSRQASAPRSPVARQRISWASRASSLIWPPGTGAMSCRCIPGGRDSKADAD